MRNFKETEEKLSVIKFSNGMKTLLNQMKDQNNQTNRQQQLKVPETTYQANLKVAQDEIKESEGLRIRK